MNINKWLQKYNRTLILVFMALLLVVFLIGDVLNSLVGGRGGPTTQAVGTATALDTKLTQIDLQHAKSMAQICSDIGMRLSGDDVANALLLKEARNMGIRIGTDQVKSRLIAQLQENVTTVVEALMRRYTASEDTIYSFIGDGMAVSQMVAIQSLAAGDSFARAKLNYRNQNQAAVYQHCTIDAEALLEDVAEPTDEEARAFFEENKDIDPATATDSEDLVFGYRLPDRVKIEYITIDPGQIKIERIRTAEVRDYFEDFGRLYTKDGEPDPAAGPDAPPPQEPKTFEEAETDVRADFRVYKGIQEAQRIMDVIRSEAFEPWLGQTRTDAGFYKTPSRVVSLRELYDRYRKEGYPIEYNLTSLSTKQELMDTFNPRIPTLRLGRRSVTLPDYAFRTEGLFEPEENDNVGVLSIGEPTPVMMTNNFIIQRTMPYQPYVAAVLEVAPAGPADNFEARKAEVKRNLKMRRAYELAGELAQQLAERAREVGLEQAYEEAEELKKTVAPANTEAVMTDMQTRQLEILKPSRVFGRFTRGTSQIHNVGPTPGTAEKVFALAEQDGEHKAGAIGIPRAKKWIVAELEEVKPVYQGDFEQRAQQMQSFIERYQVQMGLLDPQNIRERTGYEERRDENEEEAS